MKKYLCLLWIVSLSAFAADTGVGTDHPSRWGGDYVYVASQENRFNLADANTALPVYQSAPPASAATSGNLTLRRGFFNRVELWQRVDTNWFLSQYAVLNDTGAYVGQLNPWTQDTANRARTRADMPWYLVAHWNKDAMRLLRTDNKTTVSYEVKYPISLVAPNGQAGVSIDRSVSNGQYTDNGFNLPLSVTTPYSHLAKQYAATDRQNKQTFSYNLILGMNGEADCITLGSATVTVIPVAQTAVTIPEVIQGFPTNVPCALDLRDLYPQSRTVIYLQQPDGHFVLVWDSLDQFKTEGTAASTTAFLYNAVVNIAQHLTESGDYRLVGYTKTPVTPNTGVNPPTTVSTNVPGYWEKFELSGINQFKVIAQVNFKGNLIELK